MKKLIQLCIYHFFQPHLEKKKSEKPKARKEKQIVFVLFCRWPWYQNFKQTSDYCFFQAYDTIIRKSLTWTDELKYVFLKREFYLSFSMLSWKIVHIMVSFFKVWLKELLGTANSFC